MCRMQTNRIIVNRQRIIANKNMMLLRASRALLCDLMKVQMKRDWKSKIDETTLMDCVDEIYNHSYGSSMDARMQEVCRRL